MVKKFTITDSQILPNTVTVITCFKKQQLKQTRIAIALPCLALRCNGVAFSRLVGHDLFNAGIASDFFTQTSSHWSIPFCNCSWSKPRSWLTIPGLWCCYRMSTYIYTIYIYTIYIYTYIYIYIQYIYIYWSYRCVYIYIYILYMFVYITLW